MYNETFSASQARQIASTAEDIMDRCIRQIREKSEQFAREVSYVWEDQNAVGFFSDLKLTLENMGENINNSHKGFINMIEGIANEYAKIANMPRVSILSKRLQISVDFSEVKASFVNSAFPDSFGFNDINTAPAKVMDSLDNLVKDLNLITTNAVDSIKAIHAFGNPLVQNAIANCAGRIVAIIRDAISGVKAKAQEGISETAKAYLRAGIKAADSAAGIASNGTQEAQPSANPSGSVPPVN